jgi:photosystem II oxygen-evolving enhancer protein 1
MKFRSFTKAIFTLCISLCMLVVSGLFSTNAIAAVEPGLTYDQIVNTGLANKCSDILGSSRGGRNFQSFA